MEDPEHHNANNEKCKKIKKPSKRVIEAQQLKWRTQK